MADATAIVLQYGLAGVVILAQSWVILRLYSDNQRLHNDKTDLQNARLVDAQETIEKVSQPLASLSQTVNLMYDKFVVGRGKR